MKKKKYPKGYFNSYDRPRGINSTTAVSWVLGFALLFVALAGSVNALNTSNIISFYNFETVLTDTEGNVNLANNSSTFTTGKLDSYSLLVGSGAYASAPYDSDMNANAVSICSWAYPTSLASAGYIINRFGGTTATDRVWYLSNFRNGGATDFTGASGFVGNGSSVVQAPTTANSWKTNEWSYVCFSHNNSNSTTSMYINGTLNANTITVGNLLSSTTIGWAVGASNTGTTPFTGRIDALLVYNGTLTAADAADLFADNGNPYADLPFSITARDNLTAAAINTFNATINGTVYQTTNGTIVTPIVQSGGYVVNITTVEAQYYITGELLNVNTSSDQQINLTPYATVFASDRYDNATINASTVEYDGTNYTSNSTGHIRVPATTELFNFTVYSTNYISRSFTNVNRSTTYNASIWQALVTFAATEVVSENSVTGFGVTAPTGQYNASTPPTLYFKAGTYNITFNKTGWYSKTQEFTIPALSTGTYNFTDVYQYLLNISLVNISSGTNVNTFTAVIVSGLYSYNTTDYTTNGSLVLPWANDTNINITVNATGIATTSQLNSTSIYTSTPTQVDISIRAYTSESITFRFFDETTGALLNGTNVTAWITSSLMSRNFTTSNGTEYEDLLTPASYVITYNASGYGIREYYYEVTDESTTTLDLYLLSTSLDDLVRAQVFNTLTQKVEGATVSLEKKNLSGTNYYVVEMCMTNALGQCLLHPNLYDTTYRIIIDYDGEEKLNTNDTKIDQTVLSFTIVTEEGELVRLYELESVEYELLNFSSDFSFYYYDGAANTVQGCLRVESRTGASYTTVSESCLTATTGNISSAFNTTTADEWIATGYLILDDGTVYVLDSMSIVTSEYLTQFGKPGLFYFGFILAGVVMFAALPVPIAMVVNGVIVMFVLNMIGVIGIGTTTALTLFCIGIVFLMLLKRS